MTLSGMVSIACLAITGALATWAIFSRHYDDSLLQRVGLSMLAVACILRLPLKIDNPDTPPEILVAQLGLCCYGIGTALKLYKSRPTFERRIPRSKRRGTAHGA